jgi:hypothetical protein
MNRVHGYHQDLVEENGYHCDLTLTNPVDKNFTGKKRSNNLPCCCGSSWSLLSTVLGAVLLLVLISGAVYVLWPMSPEIEIKNWKLNGVSIGGKQESGSVVPTVQLNVSLDLLIQMHNPNYVGGMYDLLTVQICYRGVEIGVVQSERVSIKAQSTVNFTATVDLEGHEILDKAKELWIDVSKGELPLTTLTTVDGAVQFLFIKPHVQVALACNLVVDPKEQVLLSEDCGLETGRLTTTGSISM